MHDKQVKQELITDKISEYQFEFYGNLNEADTAIVSDDNGRDCQKGAKII